MRTLSTGLLIFVLVATEFVSGFGIPSTKSKTRRCDKFNVLTEILEKLYYFGGCALILLANIDLVEFTRRASHVRFFYE